MASNQAPTNHQLSEEAKNKLLELQAKLQEHISSIESSSKFIKFKQGNDSKVLKFEPECTHTEYIYRHDSS